MQRMDETGENKRGMYFRHWLTNWWLESMCSHVIISQRGDMSPCWPLGTENILLHCPGVTEKDLELLCKWLFLWLRRNYTIHISAYCYSAVYRTNVWWRKCFLCSFCQGSEVLLGWNGNGLYWDRWWWDDWWVDDSMSTIQCGHFHRQITVPTHLFISEENCPCYMIIYQF